MTTSGATAQQLYAALHRDHIGPALRTHGFTGTTGAYRIRSKAGDLGRIRFVRSVRSSTREHAFFSFDASFRTRYRTERLRLAGLPITEPDMPRLWDIDRPIRDLAAEERPNMSVWPFAITVDDHPAAIAGHLRPVLELYCVPMIHDCFTAAGFLRQFDRHGTWDRSSTAAWSAVMAELDLRNVAGAIDRIADWAAGRLHSGLENSDAELWATTVTLPFRALSGYPPEEHPGYDAMIAERIALLVEGEAEIAARRI